MSSRYWLDLVFEGQKLTEAAERVARDLSLDIEPTSEGRARTRATAERYRESVKDHRDRDPDRAEHQLQDVIDAYRWNHPSASRAVRRNIGFSRPGR